MKSLKALLYYEQNEDISYDEHQQQFKASIEALEHFGGDDLHKLSYLLEKKRKLLYGKDEDHATQSEVKASKEINDYEVMVAMMLQVSVPGTKMCWHKIIPWG